MKLSLPKRGSVIRYSYLWADEHRRGAEEGVKDRPVLVLAISVVQQDGQAHMLVLPVTHSPPSRSEDAIELSAGIKFALGLDELRSWVVTTEANAFVWPGPDIRPVPGHPDRNPVYGVVPAGFLTRVAKAYLARRELKLTTLVKRT